MSRKPRNNHYHYAEKFENRRKRRFSAEIMKAPKKAVFLAMLFLLAFGFISTTFAAYVSSEDFNAPEGSLIISVRNTRAQREGKVEDLALTGANADLAGTGAVTDLRYNSNTIGWGTNSSIMGNSNGFIIVSFSSASNESFKIYHDGWDSAYFSKNSAAVSLNTEYSLNNTGSNPNMTYSFAAGTYAFYITNADTYNDMKMTIYHLFDGDSYYYLNAGTHWDQDNPVIGAYFCESADGTAATWVKAESCADKTNSHIYRVKSPSGAKYRKLVWGRFKTGTTQAQMSFTLASNSGHLWNQSTDQLYQAPNTVFNITSTGDGITTKAGVSIAASAHTHTYYAYEVARSTTDGAYETNLGTISSGTTLGCTSSGPTLTATDRSASGYIFDGWFRGTTAGESNTGEEPVSADLTYTPTNYSGSSYYYAKYTLTNYDIIYHKSPDTATGTIEKGAKQYDVSYTITNDVYERVGYTQAGWNTTQNATTVLYSAGASYTTNADLELYPVWTLNAPSINITSDNYNYTVGDPAIELTHSASHAGGLTITKEMQLDPDYSSLQPSSGDATITTSDGKIYFTATTPGVYYLKLTGTVSDAATTNGSASASDVCTVTVKPAVPEFDIALAGKIDEQGKDGSTSELAYRIMKGENYTFSASASAPVSGYTYTWSLDGSTWNNCSGASAPYASAAVSTTTGTNDHISFASVFASTDIPVQTFTLHLKAEQNGVFATSTKTVYYYVQRIVETFELLPEQKIYATDSSYLLLNVLYNVLNANASGYDTTVKVSQDNITYTEMQKQSGGFISDFSETLRKFFYPAGVKYTRLEVQKNVAGVQPEVHDLHTTVGTDDVKAAKTVYFKNQVSGLDLSENKRVMVFWHDSTQRSGYRWLTAQDISAPGQEGTLFRANLPANVSEVVFAVADTSYYSMPVYDDSAAQFSFSTPGFSCFTHYIDFGKSKNLLSVNTQTQAVDDENNPIPDLYILSDSNEALYVFEP